MEAFIQFIAGVGIFLIGSIIGFWYGFKRGGIIGYKYGANDMEESLFDELRKLKDEGKL